MSNDWDDLDRKIDAWLTSNMWWVIGVLALVLTFLVLATRCTAPDGQQGRIPGWNYCNASVPIWNYNNYSPGVVEVIWNSSNPSYRACSTFTGPRYREDGDDEYNPAPQWLDWNPQPECWSCHTNRFTGYYSYTAMAHSGGNPVGYGER